MSKRYSEEQARERVPDENLIRDNSESVNENLQRLATLNLSSDRSLQPRFSNGVVKLISAVAGLGALALIYFFLKLLLI